MGSAFSVVSVSFGVSLVKWGKNPVNSVILSKKEGINLDGINRINDLIY